MMSRTQQTRDRRGVVHNAVRQIKRGSSVVLSSPKQTMLYGIKLARQLVPGETVLLVGNLGSGKTVLVSGIACGLHIREPITSPTFVLRKRYRLPRPMRGIRYLSHVDAYRLTGARELRGVLDEMLSTTNDEVWCIEWGGRIRSAVRGAKTRLVSLEILSAHSRRCASRLLEE